LTYVKKVVEQPFGLAACFAAAWSKWSVQCFVIFQRTFNLITARIVEAGTGLQTHTESRGVRGGKRL